MAERLGCRPSSLLYHCGVQGSHNSYKACVRRAEAPPPGQGLHDPHALDAAASPLVRALPQYERGFREHLAEADALAAAGRQRLGAAVRLANEMEVQARPRLMIKAC